MVSTGNAVWSSRFAFIMASVGFAVGLGNIWRFFPAWTGENGGSAFVVIYLLCAVAIGIPCLMAELLVGRRGGGSLTMAAVANESGKSDRWRVVGGLGVAYTIAITYAVVVGWVLWYLARAFSSGFTGFDATTAELTFSGLLADNKACGCMDCDRQLYRWRHYLCGRHGRYRARRDHHDAADVLTAGRPEYLQLLCGRLRRDTEWLFTPDFSKVSGATFLAAVGQAFFSIVVSVWVAR